MVEKWSFCGVHLESVSPSALTVGVGVGVIDGIESICTGDKAVNPQTRLDQPQLRSPVVC